ncbi:MAG TPA: geranylgeranyl reductase family protein [Armatimonadota bacterium]|nr:geranylgeranyl reductase family protein [Armatimonadota bacterium]
MVVGGGPAGCTAARRLALGGCEVTLFERRPGWDKPCGGGIPQAYVDLYDIPPGLIERHTRELVFHAPSGREAHCPLGEGTYLAMVHRRVFDAYLRSRATEAGVSLVTGHVTEARVSRTGVEVVVDTGGTRCLYSGDAVIGADGVNSTVAGLIDGPMPPYLVTGQYRIGRTGREPADYDAAVHIFYMPELSSSAYGWVFPRREHFDLGVATRPEDAAALWHSLDRARAGLPPGVGDGPLLGRLAWRIPSRPRARLVADRVLLVGDAAGLVAPLTGEGIAYAMRSGDLAAETVLEDPSDLGVGHLERYHRRWKKGHRMSWGIMRRLESAFRASQWRREAMVDFFADPYVRRFVVSAYATRQIPHQRELFYGRTAAVALSCLARHFFRR